MIGLRPRRVAYSQTGAGLHGENRGNSGVLLSLWSAYVLPRLIYGLDVLKLSKSEIQKLNQFHKNFLNKSCIFRREQLTRRSICYLVNCRCRCNYTSEPLVRCVVCYAAAHLRENIAERHILIKDHKSKSWFVYVNTILSTSYFGYFES